MKYTLGTFSVGGSTEKYRESSLWQKCPICSKDCMGVDGLRAHVAEKHPILKCNRHADCDAADAHAKAKSKDPNATASHCISDDCDECFPK